jgi:YidC/Oxa1 family membrane protein insertase
VDAIVNAFHVFVAGLYFVLKFYQHLTEPILGSQSYWFAIVLLTLSVRVLLIPLTVKQVRASRAMSEMAPEIKKLQTKYKGDREKLNQEMMALYKERGANPLAGCLPLVAQAPFFFALYRVIFQPTIAGEPNILRDATFFGVPLSTHWMQLAGWDKVFSLSGIVILVLILAMSATTYISQRQLMARQAEVNPQQAMIMKVMPLMFLVFSINFPLAVIIYWVTTNLWSMGQQYMLLRDRPKVGAAGASSDKSTKGGSSPPPSSAKAKSGQNGSKPGQPSSGSKARGGIFGSLRSVIDQAQGLVGERRNGGGDAPKPAASQTKQQPKGRSGGQNANAGRSKSSSNGNPPDGGASSKKPRSNGTTGADGAADVAKGSTAGRKPASPPRSGGGKSGGSSQQRRRKR